MEAILSRIDESAARLSQLASQIESFVAASVPGSFAGIAFRPSPTSFLPIGPGLPLADEFLPQDKTDGEFISRTYLVAMLNFALARYALQQRMMDRAESLFYTALQEMHAEQLTYIQETGATPRLIESYLTACHSYMKAQRAMDASDGIFSRPITVLTPSSIDPQGSDPLVDESHDSDLRHLSATLNEIYQQICSESSGLINSGLAYQDRARFAESCCDLLEACPPPFRQHASQPFWRNIVNTGPKRGVQKLPGQPVEIPTTPDHKFTTLEELLLECLSIDLQSLLISTGEEAPFLIDLSRRSHIEALLLSRAVKESEEEMKSIAVGLPKTVWPNIGLTSAEITCNFYTKVSVFSLCSYSLRLHDTYFVQSFI
ncbi:unnamed protein product [Protopolystoma xenopodis]|uniref:Uncharacterized protein n=1 Tax=Protopolystoma xenopodis TaxID=117903 RepID=A0A3S4ZIL8_9PLAT|nr:unnamed protein product [Protopolystoma xenopodis]